MSALSDRLMGRRRDIEAMQDRRRQPEGADTERRRDRSLLWSRVIQEVRDRALVLTRRAFPWRYY